MSASPDSAANSLDWTQWVCPGPRRVFSAEELARAGRQPWPNGITQYVLGNSMALMFIFLIQLPPSWRLPVLGLTPLLAVGVLGVGRLLWRHPRRGLLNLASWLATGAFVLGLWLLQRHYDLATLQLPLLAGTSVLVLVLSAWWFLTLYRVQQIGARLAELDEQARSLALGRRLANAQLQPHFLFNTLASVQHWVDTLDPRAGPTLQSFTRYLRATLPMFERDCLALTEELQIVRSYLEVMQARLGARLQWRVEVEPGLGGMLLPPGALLTLVENAIAHGIEPSLRGGTIVVSLRRAGGALLLEVADDGVGLCDEKPTEGVGLSNTRERLRQLHGAAARLELLPADPGCLARITIEDAKP